MPAHRTQGFTTRVRDPVLPQLNLRSSTAGPTLQGASSSYSTAPGSRGHFPLHRSVRDALGMGTATYLPRAELADGADQGSFVEDLLDVHSLCKAFARPRPPLAMPAPHQPICRFSRLTDATASSAPLQDSSPRGPGYLTPRRQLRLKGMTHPGAQLHGEFPSPHALGHPPALGPPSPTSSSAMAMANRTGPSHPSAYGAAMAGSSRRGAAGPRSGDAWYRPWTGQLHEDGLGIGSIEELPASKGWGEREDADDEDLLEFVQAASDAAVGPSRPQQVGGAGGTPRQQGKRRGRVSRERQSGSGRR